MNCNFTYRHYQEAIALAKKRRFFFYTMNDFLKKKPKDNFIVFRHDVDISLPHALAMATFEKSQGIRSTYFIRTRGVFNPFYGKNLQAMKQIAKLGHEIGFHYEFENQKMPDFKREFLSEKKNFENLLGVPIQGAALHKTKKLDATYGEDKLNILEPFLSELNLEYDAYSDAFTKDMKYISDSAYRWREGCMCKHLEKETKLCILTHPIWWSDKTTSLVSLIEELQY